MTNTNRSLHSLAASLLEKRPILQAMTAGKSTFVVAACSVLMLVACSSDSPADTAISPSTSTTATTVETTTTTTAPTTTTLSEQDKVEADVEELVTEWFLKPFDTSKGVDGNDLEDLTGLLRQRSIELVDEMTSNGQVLRSRGGERIEITHVEVDLNAGQGTVDACTGSDVEIFVTETQEVLVSDDPDYLTTGEFLVELTDDGWKINEWYPTQATDDPVECEFTEQ